MLPVNMFFKITGLVFFWFALGVILFANIFVQIARRDHDLIQLPPWVTWSLLSVVTLQILVNIWDWIYGNSPAWPVIYKKSQEDRLFDKIIREMAKNRSSITITDHAINGDAPNDKVNLRRLINKILILSKLDPVFYKSDKFGIFEKNITINRVKRKFKFDVRYDSVIAGLMIQCDEIKK